ncbi:hypothetical protein BDP27DRAFT_1241042, partial [Rhodocollybia butyracea]
VFGARPPNVADDKQATTADSWSFWLLYIGPVLLQDKFRSSIYHRHFCDFSVIVENCLQFEIDRTDIQELRKACEKWVLDYEKLYYQYEPERVSACPLTIHGLLHVPDALVEIGPVWTHWAFPTERYCGRLQPAIKSRRHPFVAIDNYIVLQAQLSQIKLIYGVESELSLKVPRSVLPANHFSVEQCTSILYSSAPHRPSSSVPKTIIEKILICFATRFDTTKAVVRRHLDIDTIVQWAKVRRLNGGDEMAASALVPFAEDRRDTTFIRYDMLVDLNTRRRRVQPVYQKQSFYGQLQHILVVTLPAAEELGLNSQTTFVLAAIHRCQVQGTSHNGAAYYEQMGALEVVDMSAVQCLIGRIEAVNDMRKFVIDRTGTLQSSYYVTGE